MNLRSVRRRCEATLSRLDIPEPFDVATFCDRLAEQRGRPIRLLPTDAPAGPCGLWAAGQRADYIFYEQATSPLHQEHIVLHEVGHLLHRHDPNLPFDAETASRLLPDLDAAMVRRVLGRTGYSSQEEMEAEMFATVVLERVGRHPPSAGTGRLNDRLLARLDSALERPERGWCG